LIHSSRILAVIALARAGSLEHAWRLLRESGLDQADADPAALSVRGRLLKDSALRASGAERQRLYRESAKAYEAASGITGETYPLINAATLSLLAGDAEWSGELARRTLERLARDGQIEETPYYVAATRAEALLLTGYLNEAKAAFRDAIALAPRAYEDHATTLRQFALILDVLGMEKSWLDAHRPPRALHFAGHMAADGDLVKRQIRNVLAQDRIGFGYGALAAGADILVAEALLEANAELHLVLPAPRGAFRSVSVAPRGGDWSARFEAVANAATTLRCIADRAAPLSPLAIRLAAELAMGNAAMQAAALQTEAVQLLVSDEKSRTSESVAQVWQASGRRQHVIAAPRTGANGAQPAALDGHQLAALLHIDLSDNPSPDRLAAVAQALQNAPSPLAAPRWTGTAILAAYETAPRAAQAARLAGQDGDTRIAGHYAIVERLQDPFGGADYFSGGDVLQAIVSSTPGGAILVSEAFAAALAIAAAPGRTGYVGELPPDSEGQETRLYSLER
jgi:hypothetical protein